MGGTVVDRLHTEFRQLVEELGDTEISLRVTAEDNFRKALLLAAASYFERRIKEDILAFMDKASGDVNLVTEFIRNKAIERQYHTFFQWETANANSFFGLFGEDFKSHMKEFVRNDEKYRKAIEAFLELGRERNRLLHEDFGAFVLEKTTEEIFVLYQNSLAFTESITDRFDEYLSSRSSYSADEAS